MMYEHLILEPGLADNLQIQRVAVPEQEDSFSCGWRTCFNASLLLKRVLGIPSVSIVDYSITLFVMFAMIDMQ